MESHSTSAILGAIRAVESGGNYNAKNSSSSASGAYQFTNATWRDACKLAGVNTEEYPTAKSASKEDQDQVAEYWFEHLRSMLGSNDKAIRAWNQGPGGIENSAAYEYLEKVNSHL